MTTFKLDEIIAVANALKPGESIVYYTGNLAYDANADKPKKAMQESMLALSDENRIHLTQRRFVSPDGLPFYEYIATGALP